MTMQANRSRNGQHETGFGPAMICAVVVSMMPAIESRSSFGDECRVLEGHRGRVLALAFSADGEVLASRGDDEIIQVWKMASESKHRMLRDRYAAYTSVSSIAMSPNGRTLAAGGWLVQAWNATTMEMQGVICIWDIQIGRPVRTFLEHDFVMAVALSPDGKTLASSGFYDRRIKLWNVKTGKERLEIRGQQSAAHCVAFSPDGKIFVSAGGYGVHEEGGDPIAFDTIVGELMLWNADTGKLKRMLVGHTYHVTSVAFSANGKMLASLSSEEVRVWDLRNGKLMYTIERKVGPLHDVDFSPDGKTLVYVANEIVFCDAHKGQETGRIENSSRPVCSVAYSPDGKKLAAGCSDGTIRLWDAGIGPQQTARRPRK